MLSRDAQTAKHQEYLNCASRSKRRLHLRPRLPPPPRPATAAANLDLQSRQPGNCQLKLPGQMELATLEDTSDSIAASLNDFLWILCCHCWRASRCTALAGWRLLHGEARPPGLGEVGFLPARNRQGGRERKYSKRYCEIHCPDIAISIESQNGCDRLAKRLVSCEDFEQQARCTPLPAVSIVLSNKLQALRHELPLASSKVQAAR